MSATGYAYAPSIGMPCTAATATSEPMILLSREELPGLLINTVQLSFYSLPLPPLRPLLPLPALTDKFP
nr:hypothetical protein [Nostoc sp. CmiVER01]